MRKLRYGGDLLPGDFIAISNGNHTSFGWYVGNGRGTLQYYWMGIPGNCYKDYEEWLNMSNEEKAKHKWKASRFKEGFTRKCLWKSYINAVHDTRVIKLINPEEIFTEQEDREHYEKSKEALILLKFIKQ